MNEQEIEELRERIEYGRKAKIAREILGDFLLVQRANTINQLETGSFPTANELEVSVMYLRLLKQFELTVKTYIDTGEIAEKEMNENA